MFNIIMSLIKYKMRNKHIMLKQKRDEEKQGVYLHGMPIAIV